MEATNGCTEQDILPHLQSFADHLVFDSESIDDLAIFSHKMLKEHSWGRRIVDMNWARFTGWRQVLYHAFDTPERVEELRNSSEIHITYNSQPSSSFKHHDTQAIYMQAWLAAQLGWNFHSKEKQDNHIAFNFTSNGSPLTVVLKPAKFGVFAPGALVSVSTAGSAGDSTSLVRNENTPKQISAQICSAYTCELPFTIPLNTMTRGLTFIKQILYTPVSPHYHKMLEMLSEQH